MNDTESFTKRLETLLEEERALLLKGQLDALPELLDRKRDIVANLEKDPALNLSALHGRLTRNHALLSNAMEGIRRVSERLETLKHMQQSLDTYDSQGHRKTIDTHPGRRMEKRA